jgi:hypothetical protein
MVRSDRPARPPLAASPGTRPEGPGRAPGPTAGASLEPRLAGALTTVLLNPAPQRPVLDIDATLVTAHSEKEEAAGNASPAGANDQKISRRRAADLGGSRGPVRRRRAVP